MDLEHAVLELGVDLRAVRGVRQRETPEEASIRPFDAVILLALLRIVFLLRGQ
jgi:hypothetical protein